MSVFYANNDDGNAVLPGVVQLIFRIKEIHEKNCVLGENNLSFADPDYEIVVTYNIEALDSGYCVFSIVVPTLSESITEFNEYYLPGLVIDSLNYNGSSEKAKLVNGYNTSFQLFEFDNETSYLLKNSTIFGNLISIIIPPNGRIDALHFTLNAVPLQMPSVDFDTYYFEIITMPESAIWIRPSQYIL
uniref:Uncharacterized protein n=1 Tax=Acrobeloides nanus TaxID=290746 RepID=A0A914E6C5_9BILA